MEKLPVKVPDPEPESLNMSPLRAALPDLNDDEVRREPRQYHYINSPDRRAAAQDRVYHDQWGEGEVLQLNGGAYPGQLKVKFDSGVHSPSMRKIVLLFDVEESSSEESTDISPSSDSDESDTRTEESEEIPPEQQTVFLAWVRFRIEGHLYSQRFCVYRRIVTLVSDARAITDAKQRFRGQARRNLSGEEALHQLITRAGLSKEKKQDAHKIEHVRAYAQKWRKLGHVEFCMLEAEQFPLPQEAIQVINIPFLSPRPKLPGP